MSFKITCDWCGQKETGIKSTGINSMWGSFDHPDWKEKRLEGRTLHACSEKCRYNLERAQDQIKCPECECSDTLYFIWVFPKRNLCNQCGYEWLEVNEPRELEDQEQ